MTEDQKSLEEVTKKLKNRGGGRKRVAKPLNVADLDLEKMGPDARKQIEAALTDTDKTTVKKDDEVLVVDKPNKRVKRVKAREFSVSSRFFNAFCLTKPQPSIGPDPHAGDRCATEFAPQRQFEFVISRQERRERQWCIL